MKNLLKFERLLETYLAFAPRGFSTFDVYATMVRESISKKLYI